VSWSEQQRIEAAAPSYLRNVVRIYHGDWSSDLQELTPMKKDQVDLENKVVWIPDSKTPNGVAEVPLAEFAVEAFRDQVQLAGNSPFLFASEENDTGHQTTFKTAWRLTLRRAKVPYFRMYDLRSTYATRLSAAWPTSG
jgi:integrase